MDFWDREKYIEDNPYYTEKDCPFCETTKEDEQFIIHETKHWKILYNKFPYYSEKHIMSVPKRHVAYSIDLNNEELLDYKFIEIYIKDFFWNDKNYYSITRQSLWGRSIEHLHNHYLPGHISFENKNNNNIFNIKNK